MDVKAALVTLGWRNGSARSVMDFQRGWSLGAALAVDGLAGPATQAALTLSLARKAKGLPDFSANFSAVEFQCNCGEDGRTVATDCRRIWTPRSTVQMAERLRTLVGPFTPERACRCERENKRVGGAPKSQHLTGRGLDIPIYTCTIAQIRAATGCDGVGTYYKNGRLYARHIDDRGSWAQWAYPPKAFTPLKPRPDLATAAPKPIPTPAPPTPQEPPVFFLVQVKGSDPVYKSDGFHREHIDKVALGAFTKAGAKVTALDTAAELDAFGPVEAAS